MVFIYVTSWSNNARSGACNAWIADPDDGRMRGAQFSQEGVSGSNREIHQVESNATYGRQYVRHDVLHGRNNAGSHRRERAGLNSFCAGQSRQSRGRRICVLMSARTRAHPLYVGRFGLAAAARERSGAGAGFLARRRRHIVLSAARGRSSGCSECDEN
jgi:hypothetical protein